MKFLLCGDLHADLDSAEKVADVAVNLGVDEILMAGDWGFIWPSGTSVRDLSYMLSGKGVHMRFIDGNHDWHEKLFAFPRDQDSNVSWGGSPCPNLTYQHRGSIKEYPDGTRVVFMGGAPSIDYRIRSEGRTWWKTEYITEDDVTAACKHLGDIDILMTHDSMIHPPGFKETSDMGFNYRSLESHTAVSRVIEHLKPKLHVHGHYHHRYNDTFSRTGTNIVGLASNINTFKNMILFHDTRPKAE